MWPFEPSAPTTKQSTPITPKSYRQEEEKKAAVKQVNEKGRDFASIGSTARAIGNRQRYLDSIE